MRLCLIALACLITGSFVEQSAIAEDSVPAYLLQTQKERKLDRWTIDEWMETKRKIHGYKREVRGLSDPKIDKFKPEAFLEYRVSNGTEKGSGDSGEFEDKNYNGTRTRVQLWGTNLVTQMTGLRLPNVDVGFEHAQLLSGKVGNQAAAVPVVDSADTAPISAKRDVQYYSSVLRVMGHNIQDSSLVLKIGRYEGKSDVTDMESAETSRNWKGMMAGAELNLYLFDWFGVSTNALRFGDEISVTGSEMLRGHYIDYQAYVELALVRFMFGSYSEDWRYSDEISGSVQTVQNGLVGGIKLLL